MQNRDKEGIDIRPREEKEIQVRMPAAVNRKGDNFPHDMKAKFLQIIAKETHSGIDQVYTDGSVDPESGKWVQQ